MALSLMSITPKGKNIADKTRLEAANAASDMYYSGDTPGGNAMAQAARMQNSVQTTYLNKQRNLSEQEKQRAQANMQRGNVLRQKLEERSTRVDAVNSRANNATNKVLAAIGNSSATDEVKEKLRKGKKWHQYL